MNLNDDFLAAIFNNCENLTSLDISCLKGFSKNWTTLFAAETCVVKFRDNVRTGLKTLRCSQLNVKVDGVLEIASNHPYLECFEAFKVPLSDTGFQSLSNLSRLKYLGITPGMNHSPDMLMNILENCQMLEQLEIKFSLLPSKLSEAARRRVGALANRRNVKFTWPS